MTDDFPVTTLRLDRWRWAWASAVWAAAWVLMIDIESRIGLAQVAITLVLASALAAIWLPLVSPLVTTTVGVLAFDWFFVPPKYSLRVDMTEDVARVYQPGGSFAYTVGGAGRGRASSRRRPRRRSAPTACSGSAMRMVIGSTPTRSERPVRRTP